VTKSELTITLQTDIRPVVLKFVINKESVELVVFTNAPGILARKGS